jgi:hypothetical protein
MRFNSTPPYADLPLVLALLAVFGFVGEFLLMKKLLFSSRKYKHHTATYT